MSVHVISWVFKHSPVDVPGERLVLIVLADHAKEDGSAAWPSMTTIAREARISTRQARRCLRKLEEGGHITATGRSRRGTIVYSVNMKGGQNVLPEADNLSEGGGHEDPLEVTQMSAEPSLEPSVVTESPSGSLATPRERDVAFDALAEVTNAFVKREGGAVGSVLADLRKEHPELDDQELADEIAARARAFKQQWPNHSCTPTALGRHWRRLAEWPSSSATIDDLIRRAGEV